MQHLRPEGLSEGYFCTRCGHPCGMMGHKECESNLELVETLEQLNESPSGSKLRQARAIQIIIDHKDRNHLHELLHELGYMIDENGRLIELKEY